MIPTLSFSKKTWDDMRTCWATCLGDCADGSSGEHVITGGVFTVDAVKVRGLSWCPDDFKSVGLASSVQNVLCKAHNSRLSEADDAAISLRNAICNAASLSEKRKLLEPQSWQVQRFLVNGFALERWCLKTLINIAFGGQVPIGRGASPSSLSVDLVEVAFGIKQFQPPRAGLYWIRDVSEVMVEEVVSVTTFAGDGDCLAGARFRFWGLELLLVLDDGLSIGPFRFTSQDGSQTIQPMTVYRPGELPITVNDRLSHVLEFVWLTV